MAAIDPADPAGLRRRLEEMIRETLAAYREFPEQGESLAVRLPLAADLGAAIQADLWAQAFQGNLKKCPAFPSIILELAADGPEPTAPVPAGRGAGTPVAVSLVWRELKREDAWLFSGRTGEYEFIENLCSTPAAPAPAAGAGAAAAAAPADEAAIDPVKWLESLGEG
jgi:hypothetical protein